VHCQILCCIYDLVAAVSQCDVLEYSQHIQDSLVADGKALGMSYIEDSRACWSARAVFKSVYMLSIEGVIGTIYKTHTVLLVSRY